MPVLQGRAHLAAMSALSGLSRGEGEAFVYLVMPVRLPAPVG